jgi:antitoxin VapB
MATARVFKSGNSQAVRLPKQFRVKSKELEIERRGNEIVLREKTEGMGRAFHLLTELVNTEALKDLKRKDKPQKRRGL